MSNLRKSTPDSLAILKEKLQQFGITINFTQTNKPENRIWHDNRRTHQLCCTFSGIISTMIIVFLLLPGPEWECAVCMDKQRDSVLCPCHHMCVCVSCANTLKESCGQCPICRQQITEIIHVFQS